MSKDLDFSDGEAENDKPGDIIPVKDVSILKRFEKWSMYPLGGRREFSRVGANNIETHRIPLTLFSRWYVHGIINKCVNGI